MRLDDYNDFFDQHEDEVERRESKLPCCHMCGGRIYDYLYEINDLIYCEDCAKDEFRHDAEDYMED